MTYNYNSRRDNEESKRQMQEDFIPRKKGPPSLIESELGREMGINTLESIQEWFAVAKPEVTAKDVTTQLGCVMEEFSEMASALGSVHWDDDEVRQTSMALYELEPDDAQRFVSYINREDLLDAFCDIIVTVVGAADMLGMDLLPALDEVNNSNWSKFKNGLPILREDGKIMKNPETYFEPRLDSFV